MLAMLAGCGTILGIDDLHPPTIHGTVRDLGADTVSNAVVVLYRDPDEQNPSSTRVDDATSDARGRFAFPIASGLPLDGYLDLADPRFVRTFSHLIQPLVEHADQDVELLTLTPAGLHMLATDVGRAQDPSRWIVLAQVVDAGGSSLAGATVQAETSSPPTAVSQICYTDPLTSSPCGTGISTTRDDGKAWLFDVPENTTLKITATDSEGKAHTVEFPVVAGPGLVFTPVPPAP